MDKDKAFNISVFSLILIVVISAFTVLLSGLSPNIVLLILLILLSIIFGVSSLYCIYRLEMNYQRSDPRTTFYIAFIILELVFAVLWKFHIHVNHLLEELIIEPFVALTWIPAILIFIFILLKFIISRPKKI
ncbi:hypothetical protein JW968_02315 [Candidatus Woesearchaeota archaeon]|nr:hypothetical protein [Candidatus Woesearchaeota archaeon]